MIRKVESLLAPLILEAVLLLSAVCVSAQTNAPGYDRFLPYLQARQNYLCLLEVHSKKGWFAEDIKDRNDLKRLYPRFMKGSGSLIIPVFPTVYSPGANLKTDKPYFDAIIRDAGIGEGAKVLVVGPGSGADVWLAWLRSKSKVYAADINPLAAANTRAVAALAGFPVEAVTADITQAALPAGFSGFDFVLWNMPMLNPQETTMDLPARLAHDGDDGRILDAFMAKLPGLLKKGGKAVVWNSARAGDLIPYPKTVIDHGRHAVYIITP
jgi:hypothetical protein